MVVGVRLSIHLHKDTTPRSANAARLVAISAIHATGPRDCERLTDTDVVTTGAQTMLDDSLVELSNHASVQNGQTRAGKSAIARRQALRTALIRDHMTPIAKIARLELAGTPELVSLSLPKGQPTVERLAALANGMAQAAAPYADVFIRAVMTPDFIQALRTASDDMVQALKDRTQSK